MSFFTNHAPCYGFSYTIILKLSAILSHISVDWEERDNFKFRFAPHETYDLITDSQKELNLKFISGSQEQRFQNSNSVLHLLKLMI